MSGLRKRIGTCYDSFKDVGIEGELENCLFWDILVASMFFILAWFKEAGSNLF